MAIGNFKRQPGRRLHPAPLTAKHLPVAKRPQTVLVPGLDRPLLVADTASWISLKDSLPGAGVATTTTLLSALWPDDHIVFDWRVHAAANALRVHAGLDPTPAVMAQSSIGETETLDDYALVRAWILSVAERLRERQADIERTLYRFSQDVEDEPGRTWTQYAAAVAGQLDSARRPQF